MTPNPVTVPPDTRLDVAVQEYLLHQDERALPALTDGMLLGLLSISDVWRVPPEQWPSLTVSRAMTPIERLETVSPDLPLVGALRLMEEHRRSELPVVQSGRLVGLLSGGKATHYLQIRRELGLDGGTGPADCSGRNTAA
jgi:CBS domain-containing protein